MKKILHSGRFLDYDNNIIRITFYKEKHIYTSISNITAPAIGGSYEVEVWSDAGVSRINASAYDWITFSLLNRYTNNFGNVVYKYKITVSPRKLSDSRTGELTVSVIPDASITADYEGQLTKTITITQL
jgi:hypothetical protein